MCCATSRPCGRRNRGKIHASICSYIINCSGLLRKLNGQALRRPCGDSHLLKQTRNFLSQILVLIFSAVCKFLISIILNKTLAHKNLFRGKFADTLTGQQYNVTSCAFIGQVLNASNVAQTISTRQMYNWDNSKETIFFTCFAGFASNTLSLTFLHISAAYFEYDTFMSNAIK